MNSRMISIYSSIISTYEPSNVIELAKKHNVSARTVKKDVAELNKWLLGAGSAPISWGQGDSLSCSYEPGDWERLERNLSFYEYSLEDEERLYVLLLILMLNTRYVALNEIAAFMQFSRNTILNDFRQLTQQLTHQGIHIHSQRSRGVKLRKTDEYSLRAFIMGYFRKHMFLLRLAWQRLVHSELVNPQIPALLPNEADFLNLIENAEKKSGFFLTDSSRKELTQFLLLIIARSIQGFRLTRIENIAPLISLPLGDALIKNLNTCTRYLSFIGERGYVRELLMQLNYIRMNQIPLSAERIRLQWNAKSFIQSLSKDIQLNLNQDFLLYSGISQYLACSFAHEFGHLEKKQYTLETDPVKECFPRLDFCISKNLYLLEQSNNYRITESDKQEILYFVNSAIMRMENVSMNLKILFVCDQGEGLCALLHEQIKNTLNTYHIEMTISPLLEEYLREKRPDLLISTQHVSVSHIPIVLISPAFTDEDAEKVYSSIHAIRNDCCLKKDQNESRSPHYYQAKEILLKQQAYHDQTDGSLTELRKKYISNKYSFGNLLSWNCVETGLTVSDWREALLKVCDILLKNGEVSVLDIEKALLSLEQDRSFTTVGEGIAVIPIFCTINGKQNHFSMGLIQLKTAVMFETEKSPVKYVACVKVVRGCQHLKAIHYLVNMLKD